MTLKKIWLIMLTFVWIAVGTNVYADTIGWSFTSIPIQKDSTDTTDITQDLNLKVGWLVDQTNWVYYTVGTIPSSWSWEKIAGIDVKSADNCDDADINSTCVEAWAKAVFVLKWDDSWVVLQKIIQLYWNGTKAWENWWGLHKNANWDVFLLENIGADIRIWTLVGDDLANPTLTADSPVTLDTNVDKYGGISIVNDYLFYHGATSITSYDRTIQPRFTVISLNGSTPTLVYQWWENKGDRWRLMLKLSTTPTSWNDVTPDMIQGVMYAVDSNDPLVPYSQYNAVKQGYTYALTQDYHSDRWKWWFYIKGMFIKDNKLYAIAYFNHNSAPDFHSAAIGSDGTVKFTIITDDVADSSIDDKVGKYFIMQFDFSPVNQ